MINAQKPGNHQRHVLHQSSRTYSEHQNPQPAKKDRLDKSTFWQPSKLKRQMQRRAEDSNISFSSLVAEICRKWMEGDIAEQNRDLLKLELRQIMREEKRNSDDRILFFLIKTSISTEQTRILTTNMFEDQMVQKGFKKEEIVRFIDESYEMAKKNIYRKTNQINALIEGAKSLFTDNGSENAKNQQEGGRP
jgi:hypothetical protein